MLALALRSSCSLTCGEFACALGTLRLNLQPALPARRHDPLALEHERLHPKVDLRDASLMLGLVLILFGVAAAVDALALAGELERGVRCELPIFAHARNPVATAHLGHLRRPASRWVFGVGLLEKVFGPVSTDAVVAALAPHQVRVRIASVGVVDGERVRKPVLGREVPREVVREFDLGSSVELARERKLDFTVHARVRSLVFVGGRPKLVRALGPARQIRRRRENEVVAIGERARPGEVGGANRRDLALGLRAIGNREMKNGHRESVPAKRRRSV